MYPMKKSALRTIPTKKGAEGIHIMAPLRVEKTEQLLMVNSDKKIKALETNIKTMKKNIGVNRTPAIRVLEVRETVFFTNKKH
jgi:hypothetical protein